MTDVTNFDMDLLIPSIVESVNSSTFIVYIKSARDEFLFLNDAACLAVRADIETIKNKKFEEGSKEKEIYDSLFANDIHILKSGQPKSELYSLGKGDPFSKDSTWHFTKQPIKGLDGNDYILGFGVEITNKLVENSTLNFFKDVLNHMVDAFVITESLYPFKICYANKAFLDLVGANNFAEVIGKTPTSLLAKYKSDEKLRKEFNEKLARKEICDVVFTNKNKAGKVFKSHLLVVPISSNYFVGIQRDITDSFRKNEILRRKTAQLAAIFNNISSYLWLLSPDFTILQMNRSAQIQGKYDSISYRVKNGGLNFLDGRWWKSNKECHEKLAKTLNDVMSKGVKQEIIIDFLNANDQVRKIRLTINPNRDSDGVVDYVVVDGADVTDLEKQKRQYKDIAKAQVSFSNQSTSPDKVDAWQQTGLEGKELERVVKMETTVDGLVPQVAELNKVIKDPETGLVVGVNSMKEDLAGVKNGIEKLSESAEGFFKVWGIAQKVPTIVQNPLVKWGLVLLLGAGVVNTAGSTLDRVIDVIQATEEVLAE